MTTLTDTYVMDWDAIDETIDDLPSWARNYDDYRDEFGDYYMPPLHQFIVLGNSLESPIRLDDKTNAFLWELESALDWTKWIDYIQCQANVSRAGAMHLIEVAMHQPRRWL